MVFSIILTLIFFVLSILIACKADDNDKNALEAFGAIFMLFIVMLIFTIVGRIEARQNIALYNDMAKNPRCYSINELKEAHKDIIKLKANRGCWISFYNGYEFPEINVDVMNEVDTTLHIVR